MGGFNPRTHEECDREPVSGTKKDLLFQSTHSRGVRLSNQKRNVNTETVSIHALTRSATVEMAQKELELASFNPRTHEECDWTDLCERHTEPCFNPRTHEECDIIRVLRINHIRLFQSTHSRGVRPILLRRHSRHYPVSIHALTRSATNKEFMSSLTAKFQSTHSRGVRPIYPALNSEGSGFQSTHSRGVRLPPSPQNRA